MEARRRELRESSAIRVVRAERRRAVGRSTGPGRRREGEHPAERVRRVEARLGGVKPDAVLVAVEEDVRAVGGARGDAERHLLAVARQASRRTEQNKVDAGRRTQWLPRECGGGGEQQTRRHEGE